MPTTLETYDATLELIPKQYPQDARTDDGVVTASLTLAKGTVLGKVTATGKLAAYNDSLSTGVERAVGILKHSIATDASGNVYFGTSAVPGSLNPPHRTAEFYTAGVFDTADLTGYDAAALVDFGGRVMHNGFIRIP